MRLLIYYQQAYFVLCNYLLYIKLVGWIVLKSQIQHDAVSRIFSESMDTSNGKND